MHVILSSLNSHFFCRGKQVTHFHIKANIAKVRTVDDLMKDRRLLDVSLKAFGLDDDINNKAFIRKVLAEGTIKDSAFANRLSDKRYAEFARVFGFGDLGARTGLAIFPDAIITRFNSRQFEKAVGEQSTEMRLALNVSTGIKDVLGNSATQNGQWFGIMGNAPLRTVFETALGFSSSFGQIDLDQQLTAFRSRARNIFGSDAPSTGSSGRAKVGTHDAGSFTPAAARPDGGSSVSFRQT